MADAIWTPEQRAELEHLARVAVMEHAYSLVEALNLYYHALPPNIRAELEEVAARMGPPSHPLLMLLPALEGALVMMEDLETRFEAARGLIAKGSRKGRAR
jgi:hypothetical protein